MDVGTPVLHLDSDDNLFVGQICGRDFRMQPVWRTKDGKIRRNSDGTLADRASDGKDSMKVEPVETGLFVVNGTYRDGHTRLMVVAPSDLFDAPTFQDKPRPWSHSVEAESTPAPLEPDEIND